MSNYNKDLNNLKDLRNLTPSERSSIAHQLNQIEREQDRQRVSSGSTVELVIGIVIIVIALIFF